MLSLILNIMTMARLKPLLFGIVLFLANAYAFSQTLGYPVALIADSLKQNANAVLRDEVYEFQYLAPEKTTTRHRKVVTVFRKVGDPYAALSLSYDKFNSIVYIKGSIYDATGKLIGKLKPSDIADVSASAGYDLFDDLRVKYTQPMVSTYPYTVEYEYEKTSKTSAEFPDWYFYKGENVAIQKSVFRIITPTSYKFTYKIFNNFGEPLIRKEEANTIYEWSAENIKGMEDEPYSDLSVNYINTIFTAPTEFSLDGYTGKMDSWKEYGKWIAKLNAGRDVLPEARAAEIRDLVKDAGDDLEKVRILYKYMQSRTRYFNIALGIGGLQPAPAAVVDEVGYGDCKGLSNYMKALLKAVGITSHYTIVESGEDFPQIITEIPKHQFNHAILCVPLKSDTVWLECTNQIAQFGFLGDFTSDRHVLLIKDDGGEIVRTPVYSITDNYQNTRASVTLTPDGNGEATITRNFGGLQFNDQMGNLYASPEDQKEWLYEYYDIPNYQLENYSFVKDPADNPRAMLKSGVKLTNYASASGKRLFLPLNLTNRFTTLPPKVKTRRTNIRRTYQYLDADTIEYIIPENMEVEFLPDNKEINSAFGVYKASVAKKDNSILYIREVKMYKGTFPKETYGDFVKFFNDMNVADKCQAILIKKEI
jgi:hypothetical protein